MTATAEITTTFNSAETVVETPLGRLQVWATSREHVGIRTEWAHNWRGDGPAPAETITVNRVEYALRLDIHPRTYLAEQEKKSNYGYHYRVDPHAERNGWAYGWMAGLHMLTRRDSMEHGSESATNKVVKVLFPWLVDWLDTDDGKALLAAAQARHDHNEATALRKEHAQVSQRLLEIGERLRELGA